jgi:NhaP-type Na+/H+ or K+/H+ antiporter
MDPGFVIQASQTIAVPVEALGPLQQAIISETVQAELIYLGIGLAIGLVIGYYFCILRRRIQDLESDEEVS